MGMHLLDTCVFIMQIYGLYTYLYNTYISIDIGDQAGQAGPAFCKSM